MRNFLGTNTQDFVDTYVYKFKHLIMPKDELTWLSRPVGEKAGSVLTSPEGQVSRARAL
jgi:hypothetical protein